jgi:protein gp37
LGGGVRDHKTRWRHPIPSKPAALRFLSVEPLLERVALDPRGIGWVIVGGESGAGARPMLPAWVRDVRQQCAAARVPLFVSQTGSNRSGWPGVTGKGDDPAEWPRDLRMQEFPPPLHS